MSASSRKMSLRISVLIACAVLPLLLLLALSLPLQAGTVFYAAPSAVGTGDCGSWANACTLQTAIGNSLSGDEIWVLEGVHKPATVIADRTATFFLPDGVAIYGGYAGWESAREERDWENNLTILSGDIDNNDLTDPAGVVTNTANITGTNSYHVVTSDGAGTTAMLDGFTITAGYADGAYFNNCGDVCGGGLYNFQGHPTLNNLTFIGNHADNNGGGLYNNGNSFGSSPILSNTTFLNNDATYGGGMASEFNSNPYLTNVSFSGNHAVGFGGGMYSQNAGPILFNVFFANNQSEAGGGLYNLNSSATLTTVTFIGNAATSGDGGGMYVNFGQASLSDVTFEDNTAVVYGGGLFTANTASSTLTATTFISNSAGYYGGGMANQGSTSSLNNMLFISNTAIIGGGIYNFVTGSHTLSAVTFESNVATSHGGGMYNEVSAALENVAFANNAAVYGGGFYNFGNTGDATLLEVSFSGNSAEYGGGMYDLSGSPTLATVSFIGNAATAGDGGGLYKEQGPASLSDVTFESNTATQFGGGLFNNSATLTLTATTFITNDAPHGGGMANFDGFTSISNTLFSGNTAISGGGMKNQFGGNITLSAVTFAGNQASERGGGLDVNCPTVLDHVTFIDNEGYDGGGMYAILNEISLSDVFFDGNTATRNGGGLDTRSAAATLTATTFISNSADYGGGMANLGSITSLTNTLFMSNTAISGGGVFNAFDGSSSLTGVTFTGNQASSAGGGMYNELLALLQSVSFTNNEAYDGGGLYNYGSPGNATLLEVSFTGNIAEYGGGMFDVFGQAALSNVLFQGNTGNTWGGGLYENHGGAVLTNVLFVENLSQAGGGMAAYDSSPMLTNVLFRDNNASTLLWPHEDSGRGGGLYNFASHPTLTNATFSGNEAEVGGGAMYSRSTSNPLINNSIFWGNTPEEFNSDATGTLVINYSNVAGGCPAGGTCSHLLDSDPFFADPTGGDLRLLPGSPSIDAGDNSVITTPTDLSGGARFIDIPSSPDTGLGSPPLVDMGAYEASFVDVAMLKTVSPSTFAPGTAITFTLAFSNGGSITATSVTVSDEVPWYLTSPAWSASGAAVSDTGQLPPFIWSVQDLVPGHSALITVTGVLTAPLAAGTYTNTAVIAVDEDAAVGNNSATLTFEVPNVAPIFNSVPLTTATQDTPYSYSISAEDLNGDILTIIAPTKPDWLMLTENGDGTATLSGTPDNGDVGDHGVLLRVTDSDGLMAEQPFTITVANVNDPPVFTGAPLTAATQDLLYSYSVTTDDPDLIWGDVLTITSPTLPAWLTLTDNGDGTATLSGTPDNGDVGDHDVLLLVTDGNGLTDDQSFTISVANVNDPPVFTSVPITTVTQGLPYLYVITVNDPDLIWGDVLTVTVLTKPEWLTLVDNVDGTATLSGSPDKSDVGGHPVLLRVIDNVGLADTQSFTITVRGRLYLPLLMG